MTSSRENGFGLAPWLSVYDAEAAVRFYVAAFGAEVPYRLDDDGVLQVAQLTVGGADFWVQHEPAAAPADVERSPVRMIVTVGDPDAAFARALAAGGREVTPVTEQYGWRIGRFADPFGHHWEIGRRLE
ncbi:MAG TPA: VOC family protein [Kribbellaceae bacterium]|nr:VOC family protein [Kribbellaceae bacterium]